MNQSNFGKLLRDKRKEHHKTQEEVANSINKNKKMNNFGGYDGESTVRGVGVYQRQLRRM